MWARRPVSLTTCPVSYVTPESVAYLEYYGAWQFEGRADMSCVPARRADAFMILEQETRKEASNG